MINEIIEIVSERLERDMLSLQESFIQSNHISDTRSFVVDDLLPQNLANEIYESFPKKEGMRCFSSFREVKYTFKKLEVMPELLSDITFAIQSPKVVSLIEKITGIPNPRPDSSLYAGGLSLMERGNFLNPHLDNSHDENRRVYRVLNLLYYVTPDWREEYGGNIELWDKRVKKAQTITSKFNRLVVMETNLHAWHSVSPVLFDGQRCCVSNYYFSEICPENKDYFHVTSFSARPNQIFRRAFCKVDNLLRNGLRLISKKGIGKHDAYDSKKSKRG